MNQEIIFFGEVMLFKYNYCDLYYSHKLDRPARQLTSLSDHFHTIYEMSYFISGNAEYFIEDKRYPLKPGSLVIVKPGQHHNIHILGPEKYERYVLRFSEYIIPSDILARFGRYSGCYYVGDTLIPSLFSRLDYHVENIGEDKETLKMLFRCVLTEIITYFTHMGGKEGTAINLLKEDMAVVLDYINKNLDHKLCLEDICREFHYSKSYICHEFSVCMGVPIIQYVRTKKIMYANALLRSGMRPTEVAMQCGFSDYSTFYRMYKKIIGKPPSNNC